jgi:hypothetical protein
MGGKDRLLRGFSDPGDCGESPALLLVLARVVDGYRGSPGDFLGERSVSLAEVPAGLGVDQAERAKGSPPAGEWDDQHTGQPELTRHAQALIIDGGDGEHVVGHVGVQLGDSRANDVRHAYRAVRIGGVAPLHLLGERDLVGVDVGDRYGFIGAAFDDLNAAPVGEPGYDQPGDIGQGGAIVQARGELGRGVLEEGQLV